MFDPLVISILVLGGCIVGGAVYLRRNPAAQAAVAAVVPSAFESRLQALENAIPTKADVEAEKTKLLTEIQPLVDKLNAAEQSVADMLKARGWTVSKA